MDFERVLTANFGVENSRALSVYAGRGGYEGLAKARAMDPDAVTEEVKKSGLRGRGGAGFPTGMKWSFVPKAAIPAKPVYLCVNADESEPGTFKDRYLLDLDPHLVIEGTLIAAHAIRAMTAFVYFRGEFKNVKGVFDAAVREAEEKGLAARADGTGGDGALPRIVTIRGAGAYICGEETGLIESLEGKRGFPRIKPPFPAVVGAFGSPTIVNNVETIAALPFILRNGAARYAALGTGKSLGTKLFCVSGPVENPGLFERPLGYPLRSLLESDCGGVRGGRKLKAVVPGGSSVPVLTAAEVEGVLLDYESLAAAGSMLGSAGIIVMDDSTCMVAALTNLARFYSHESCGQCSPCREGTGWAHRILKRLVVGKGEEKDLEILCSISRNMRGKTICVLADALAMPIDSYVAKFRSEFEAHARDGGCAGVHPGRSISDLAGAQAEAAAS